MKSSDHPSRITTGTVLDIILESKVKALTGEVEGRATRTKLGEHKAIFTKEGLPLYMPFYYSFDEIEYFSAHSSFLDEKETKNPEEVKENLKENKSRISENEDVKINTRCLIILQNQLPPKEQDPGNFTLPCSIGKLTFNALADLGVNISPLPFSKFKRLSIRGLKPINMTIEMADKTQSTPKGIMENILLKIDKFIFPVDFVILDIVEDFRMPCILGSPLLATAHAKVDIFIKLGIKKSYSKPRTILIKLSLKQCVLLGMERAS
ncbi:zinc knuckle CX2CX4HX4C containing protein [Tanacetum coccineum]|uniref:Zinc knuckle CX2CX4HX4C containing protein n=1 Tax=Tanacetum coccineum TaxID=301880 RepID=A0ABQ5HC07_9ASTR